ncbi:MAG: SDR family oxidoreductase [Dehalococcoidales bacterium]|jgi:NAD(P)-dependent dehydrogenase (short-subunit alcohol dehydrogenase family)
MDVKSFSLKGKVALVLGGAGDLGRAIAETYSLAGADVIISSRKQENLDKVAAEIKAKSGNKIVGIAGHLAKLDTVKVLVDTIMKDYGRIDVVVNSSGSSFMVPLTDVEEWQWDNVMNVNIKGPFFLCKQVAPIMKEQGGGSIINISSYMGIRTEETLGVYCISKAAVLHMTRVMAKEWGKWNIRVNSIAPAWVHSRLSEPFLQLSGVNDRMLSQTVLGRFGEPDDVAALALFLASDAGKNQTAGCFPLDYGMLT